MPKLRTPTCGYLSEHPVPHRALPAYRKVSIECFEVINRLCSRQAIPVQREPDDGICGSVIAENSERESGLSKTEPLEQLAPGFHQLTESREPLRLRKPRHSAIPRAISRSRSAECIADGGRGRLSRTAADTR